MFNLSFRFGAKIMTRKTGIILNNEMQTFSIKQNAWNFDGFDENNLEPLKRPSTVKCPVLILQNKKAVLILGASGGLKIVSSLFQVGRIIMPSNLF